MSKLPRTDMWKYGHGTKHSEKAKLGHWKVKPYEYFRFVYGVHYWYLPDLVSAPEISWAPGSCAQLVPDTQNCQEDICLTPDADPPPLYLDDLRNICQGPWNMASFSLPQKKLNCLLYVSIDKHLIYWVLYAKLDRISSLFWIALPSQPIPTRWRIRRLQPCH